MLRYKDVILFHLSKANQKVFGIFKAQLQPFGLTPMRAVVLHALYEEQGLSAGELGKRLVIDGATLSGVIDRMVEGGWIIKKSSPGDRRTLNIQLTPKALQFKDEFIKMTEELNEQILSRFRLEERLLLQRILADLS